MGRIEKTVFISYRRSTGAVWALAISQNLTNNGYDVFFDYQGIASGDFEQVILENIKARAHFLVLMTPSALERVDEPGDWLRREIEAALEHRRNIVPLMLEGFDFATPSIGSHLIGTLAPLKNYNGLKVLVEYFNEAMSRLRAQHLNVEVGAVLHPPSTAASEAATAQRAAAATATGAATEGLTAELLVERGFEATDPDTKISYYTEAIRLKPDLAAAYNNRGNVRREKGDLDGALADYAEAILLDPQIAAAYSNRGLVRHEQKGDVDGALADFAEAIRLDPYDALFYHNRGNARRAKGDTDGALADYNEAIRLKPDYAEAYNNRGVALRAKGDVDGALADYNETIRLKPDDTKAYNNRGVARRAKGDLDGALADYQLYLDLGGGVRNGNQAKVESWIRELQEKLKTGRPKRKRAH